MILVTVLATSLLLTGGAFYYKEYMVHYKGLLTPQLSSYPPSVLLAACVGKIHEFYYDTSDFYLEKAHGSSSWTLPLSHPYHLLTLLCFCAGIILCPLGYGAIYW